jgi:hypothetical protein
MNGIGSKGARGATAGESVQKVHADLAAKTPDASDDVHDIAGAATERADGAGRGSFAAAVLLVFKTLALIGATAACLVVVGLALAVWPPAAIAAAAEGAVRDQGLPLAALLATPLAVTWLLHRSWRAFARARSGRCADFMLAALVGALALHALILGV